MLLISFCLEIRFDGQLLTSYIGVIQLLTMEIATYNAVPL